MADNLKVFASSVRRAPTDKKAEAFVRSMLERFARNCPMNVLVQLGLCVIKCRRDELRQEADTN